MCHLGPIIISQALTIMYLYQPYMNELNLAFFLFYDKDLGSPCVKFKHTIPETDVQNILEKEEGDRDKGDMERRRALSWPTGEHQVRGESDTLPQ